METVLKKDATVTEWPMWNVSRSSSVTVDGQNVTDLFSMINRQIDVLRYYSRSHESQLTSIQIAAEEAREKIDRENSKLHDRLDRISRLFEQQFSTSSIEQRLKSLEEKMVAMEEQISLIRPSPIQTAIHTFQEQKKIIDSRFVDIEIALAEQGSNPNFMTGGNFPTSGTPPIHHVNLNQFQMPPRKGSTLKWESGKGHNEDPGRVTPDRKYEFKRRISNALLEQINHSKLEEIAALRNKQKKGDHHLEVTESSSNDDSSVSVDENDATNGRDQRPVTRQSLTIPFNIDLLQKLEDKIDEISEHAFEIEGRVISVEGGLMAMDSRISELGNIPTSTTAASSQLQNDVKNIRTKFFETIESKIEKLKHEKANKDDLKEKADVSVMNRKADDVKVKRLDDIVSDLDRKIIILTRDFEEGMEGVQKRHDKKLEFMTHWIMKHVKKGGLGSVPGGKSNPGDITADIGKTRCLVCDQPVKDVEKDTPYVTKGFKPTLNDHKTDVKRAMKFSNLPNYYQNTNTSVKDSKNRPQSAKTTNGSPDDLDPEGPYQRRVYYTGGGPTGMAIAAQRNTSYSATNFTTATAIPGMVHIPSSSAFPQTLSPSPGGGRPETTGDSVTSRPGNELADRSGELGALSPEVVVAAKDSSFAFGVPRGDSVKMLYKNLSSSRPSSAPAGRKESKHKKAVLASATIGEGY